ncbi:hypothetical protein AB205_0105550 [Aquarana catesbeiana]|uniref:Uncharacterized protein n=4 Tax=Aquarana catesbeiana TaxID=8400 RepID=A0A2G9RBC8_AQUCT|nr:hypothetical protein AB205_0105550 [Aquarana catesbeiana]
MEYTSETGTSTLMGQPGLTEAGVPLPSKNLIFQDGLLSEWNGRARVSNHHVHMPNKQA